MQPLAGLATQLRNALPGAARTVMRRTLQQYATIGRNELEVEPTIAFAVLLEGRLGGFARAIVPTVSSNRPPRAQPPHRAPFTHHRGRQPPRLVPPGLRSEE